MFAKGLNAALGHMEPTFARQAPDVRLFGDIAAVSGDFSNKAGYHQAHQLVWLTAPLIPLLGPPLGSGREPQKDMGPAQAVHLPPALPLNRTPNGRPVEQGIKMNGLKMSSGKT